MVARRIGGSLSHHHQPDLTDLEPRTQHPRAYEMAAQTRLNAAASAIPTNSVSIVLGTVWSPSQLTADWSRPGCAGSSGTSAADSVP
jgi:hypothetical protein